MKDQELDKLMQQIARDAAQDDASADEIADSPALWWSVQREIRNATPAKKPWPPNFLRLWLMIGTPVAAALLIGLGLYANSLRVSPVQTAQNDQPRADRFVGQPETSLVPSPRVDPAHAPIANDAKSSATPKGAVKAVAKTRAGLMPKTVMAQRSAKPAAEIKSEFIALAYARSPESGQLVRVKVPSSMMVQLGLVSTVEKPSELVDAEVLVGDDGLTHAIRFIRQ